MRILLSDRASSHAREPGDGARYMGGGDVDRQARNLERLERYRAAVNGSNLGPSAPPIFREPGSNGGKVGAIRRIGPTETE